jgi:hypothetical protein
MIHPETGALVGRDGDADGRGGGGVVTMAFPVGRDYIVLTICDSTGGGT